MTDGRDVVCQRQLAVDDNTEVASSVRDGDVCAEHQDVTAVNLCTVHWFYRQFEGVQEVKIIMSSGNKGGYV